METLLKSTRNIELYFDDTTSTFSWQFLPDSEWMNTEQIIDTFEMLMRAMRCYDPNYVLADDRKNLGLFTVGIQNWIAKTTIDTLEDCGVKRFAVVRPKSFIIEIATEQAVEAAKRIAKEVEIEMFYNLPEARKWLNGQGIFQW